MIGKTLKLTSTTLTVAGLAAALLWPAAASAETGSWQAQRAAAVAAYDAGNDGDAEARLLDAKEARKDPAMIEAYMGLARE